MTSLFFAVSHRFGCMEDKYEITTELVRMEGCRGCSMEIDSIDVDNIRDIALVQRLTPGYCLRKQG
jgi:hypothetical protein